MNIYGKIYCRLNKLANIDAILMGNAITFQSSGFMDLHLDKLDRNKIALSHYYKQNGDMMADPDMEIAILEDNMAEALTYQQDSLGIYQEVYPEPRQVNLKLKKQLNSFLLQWLKNLEIQGFYQMEEK